MKCFRLMMAAVLLTVVAACGGAPQDQPVVGEASPEVESTPVFRDDFESGEVENWNEGETPKAEDQASDSAPTD